MPSIPSQTGVEQHFSGHSPWDGLERAHPVPPYPVLAEQQARTCWEPLSLLPCTKPAGAELFSTSHPEYLASNKDPRSLDYFPLFLCAGALRYLSTCRRRARKEKKKGERCFLTVISSFGTLSWAAHQEPRLQNISAVPGPMGTGTFVRGTLLEMSTEHHECF